MGKSDNNQNKKTRVSDSQKKYIGMLLLISIIGIGLIVLGNSFTHSQQVTTEQNKASNANEKILDPEINNTETNLGLYEKSLENELVNILEAVDGVGNVMVKVTLAATAETYYASNMQNNQLETSEPLQNGEKRSTKEIREDTSVVMKNVGQGQDEPVVIKETRPEIVGVLIVADGASNLNTKEQISSAVQVLLDVPSHKVSVLAKVKED